ncbi:trehalose-phosphatase [Halorussus salilacus]|uniref:trehalose-phosphatase n=1 Tax=Halorussus salilacus TaxID=2953750 RepID=UPI0020A12A8C|nr:trehalose-phosphatase [Halorussus salilacus]USZ69547.1 trehalose-phosphatase [Halorussus salilacus]
MTDRPTERSETRPTAESEAPPPIRDHLYALVEELLAHDGLLVALDFDGTLADIERRPDEATLPEETREVVSALADLPDAEVAVVSGRELADVRERVGLSDISYAGNHGLELRTGEESEVHPTAREVEETISALCDRLGERLADVDGVIVEDKGVSATVHHRLVADEDVPAVERAVETLAADRDEVRLTTGKDVLELRPAVEWDKGEAVGWLAARLVPDDERWLPVYVGDDTTDEAAFGVLTDRGLGVKVGDDPATDAPYRVADPEGVRAVLSWLSAYGVAFLRRDPETASPGGR